MIDYDRLLAYAIPDGQQELTRKETAFYALSLGLGQDPLDERQLAFVDHKRDLKAFPTMPVVLAQPGFWVSDPATGFDVTQLVHGEQEIVIHRPTPVEGRIASRNRIVDVVDKGPSRGALLYYEKSISDGDSGEVYATCNSTMFFRADGGFGGPPRPVRPVAAMPDTAPDLTVDLETRPEQALYYRLNGDENPLHSDPASAVRAGFERPILHGLCTFGLCAHAVLRSVADYDPVRLRRFALRFSAPVFPGETIRVFVWRSGSFQAQVLGRGDMVARNGSFELAA